MLAKTERWIMKLEGVFRSCFKSVTSTKENNRNYIYAVGNIKLSVDNNYEAFITKYDTNGNTVWQKKLCDNYHNYFSSITSTIENGITYLYAVGYRSQPNSVYSTTIITKWNTSGELIWQKTLNEEYISHFDNVISTVEDNTIYLYAVGYEKLSDSSWKAFITKWDTEGNLIWQRKIGKNTNYNYFKSIASTIENNNIYLYAVGLSDEGIYSNNKKALITKWDTSGNLIWQKNLNSNSIFHSVTSTIEDNVVYLYTVGFGEYSCENIDSFIIKWDIEGNIIWQKKLNGTYDTYFRFVISTIENGIVYLYAIGNERLSTNNDNSEANNDNSEVMVTKWDTNGNLIWQKKINSIYSEYFYSATYTTEDNSIYLYAVGNEYSVIDNENSKTLVSKAYITKWDTNSDAMSELLTDTLDTLSLQVDTSSFLTAESNLSVYETSYLISDSNLTVSDISLNKLLKNY